MLSLAWYWNLTLLIFVAFVPLLILEKNISDSTSGKKRKGLFKYSYLTFLIWNIGVTWWIFFVQFGKPGAVLAWVANALLMAVVFQFFSALKTRLNRSWSVWLFIPIWLGWQFTHSLWDLAWIWLDLGNVFAFSYNWIQWYEFTGSSGGTLWVLFVNVLVFQVINNHTSLKFLSRPVLKIACSILLPILFSYLFLLYKKPLSKTASPVNTIVVQPNVDPYNDKFALDYELQFDRLLKLIKGKITDKTEYLVLPETFIVDNLNEELLGEAEPIVQMHDSLISRFPRLKIVVGASSYLFYRDEKLATATARKHQSGYSLDFFNTGLQLDESGIQVYHKSKLVPAVERMPFPALFKPLENLAIDLGGTSGSLGTQPERGVFKSESGISIAPVICYESVFSNYTTDYIRKGADFIFIITNDGWWDDTPGYKHHLAYARLRAIENRRQIARSANTGISCFIDEFGNVSEATNWWEEAVIQKDIYPNKNLSFFSAYGDLISYASLLLSALLLILYLLLRIRK
jgi:apolipoprotein N-acyltransferase